MTTTHDDFLHPVPPLAYLRWKENYFFIVMDPGSEVFGIAHFNCEPAFNRVRISANLSIAGQLYRYSSESPFPEHAEMARSIGDGRISLFVQESHVSLRLDLDTGEIKGSLLFEGRLPSFDFGACKYAAPEVPSFKEVMTLGTNLPFEHLQQSMTVTGMLTVGAGSPITVDGLGYRDHSWCMRSDNIVADHTWCGLNFPGRAFGVMTVRTVVRPGIVAMEGYVADVKGTRALRKIEVEIVDSDTNGKPVRVIHRLRDVYGEVFTIESDLLNRYAHVPLAAEKPDGSAVYEITENFCRSILLETGEEGISLVELGRNSVLGGMVE